jgi:hypothetical protein
MTFLIEEEPVKIPSHLADNLEFLLSRDLVTLSAEFRKR